MRKRSWTDSQLVNAVKENNSIYGVLRELGLKLCGGSHAKVKLRIQQLELDTSHMTGQGWCKGEKHDEHIEKHVRFKLEDILVKESTYQNTYRLKRRLVEEGLLKNECILCGQGPEWNGEPLSLQLDHKDGDRCNNTLTNLRIVCPNCHSQTESFAGKRRKKIAK